MHRIIILVLLLGAFACAQESSIDIASKYPFIAHLSSGDWDKANSYLDTSFVFQDKSHDESVKILRDNFIKPIKRHLDNGSKITVLSAHEFVNQPPAEISSKIKRSIMLEQYKSRLPGSIVVYVVFNEEDMLFMFKEIDGSQKVVFISD
jgi:hypothetical protein